MENENKLKGEFELREKRLNLVYKILYVLVFIWGAMFISYLPNPKSSAPLYCSILAIVTTSIINILIFIFRELSCMKISSDIDDKSKKLADEKFIDIWNMFSNYLYVSMILLLINVKFPSIVTQLNLIMFLLIISIFDVCFGAFTIYKTKLKFIWLKFHNIVLLLACYSLFAMFQFQT